RVRLFRFLYYHHFPALVIAAFRTRAVRQLVFMTVRALGKRRAGQMIMGAAARGASFGVPPFWIWHFGFNLTGAASSRHGAPLYLCFSILLIFRASCGCLRAPSSGGQTRRPHTHTSQYSGCVRSAGTAPCSFRRKPVWQARPAGSARAARPPAVVPHLDSSQSRFPPG